jgi:Domain of unknown function (DUF4395)
MGVPSPPQYGVQVASPSDPVDVRSDRAAQGAVAVITLGAFVFHQQWVVPILMVLVGAGALFGPPGNPFHRAFAGLVAPRIPPATAMERASTIKAQDVLATALLGVATLLILIGLGGVSWIVTLAEAGVAAVAASTGVHLGVTALDRLRRHG